MPPPPQSLRPNPPPRPTPPIHSFVSVPPPSPSRWHLPTRPCQPKPPPSPSGFLCESVRIGANTCRLIVRLPCPPTWKTPVGDRSRQISAVVLVCHVIAIHVCHDQYGSEHRGIGGEVWSVLTKRPPIWAPRGGQTPFLARRSPPRPGGPTQPQMARPPTGEAASLCPVRARQRGRGDTRIGAS